MAPSSGFDEPPPELEPFADVLPEPLELLLDAEREREPDREPDPEREPDCEREPDREPEPEPESDPDEEPWLLPFVTASG